MANHNISMRDVEATRRLLDKPPTGWVWITATQDRIEDQLAAAIRQAEQEKVLTALLANVQPPVYHDLAVRLIDLPHLAVAVYDRLVGWT